jgi:hypothetical protein
MAQWRAEIGEGRLIFFSFSVMPAQAGIRPAGLDAARRTPAFAGVTRRFVYMIFAAWFAQMRKGRVTSSR